MNELLSHFYHRNAGKRIEEVAPELTQLIQFVFAVATLQTVVQSEDQPPEPKSKIGFV
jgi:hypothetical protein